MTLRLGTLLSAPVSAPLRTALRRLARVCEPVPVTGEVAGVDAVLWYHGGPVPSGVPLVVWAVDLPLDAEPARSAAVLLAPTPLPDDRCVVLGGYPEYPNARPVAPVTRRRIRRARRLAGPALVHAGSDGWRWDGEPVPAGVEDAAAGLAAAVVALDPAAALRALAWAAPVVADPATAAALGASDGEVRIAEPAAASDVAARLAADDRAAAALAWAGRRFSERRFSAEGVLSRLPGRWVRPEERLDRALDELRAPPGATVRARAGAAVAFLNP